MRNRNLLCTMMTITALIVAVGIPQAQAQEIKEKAPPQILLKNVNIFDGKKDSLATGYDVLVEDKLIKKIGKGLNVQSATVIEGERRILMPGLIDGHAHLMINAHFDTIEKDMDLTDLAYRSVVVAERYLLDGFTSVRDMGGPVFGLRRNIDSGMIAGPRVFPSGGFIS
jgi:imidazolonepropionase-like amidohydrolase